MVKINRKYSNESTVHGNRVVARTFFAVRKSDNKIIGMPGIRHYLNDFPANYSGHTGYGMRPAEKQCRYLEFHLTHFREL